MVKRGHKYSFEEDIELLKSKIKDNNEKYKDYEICGDKSTLSKGRSLENTLCDWKESIERQRRKKQGLPYGTYYRDY